MSISRIGEMRAQEGQEDALRAFLESIVLPGVESSAGCQLCQLFQSQEDPTRFIMIEVWEDVEAHKAAVQDISPEDIENVKKLLAGAPTGEYYSALGGPVNEIDEVNRLSSGFRGVIPELPVADVDATLGYYRDVLGFSVEGRHEDESGDVVFGSVLCGRANLYFSKTEEPIAVNRCYVFLDEVDALCAAFKARGARIMEEPEDKPWGYRQFTLEDVNGHLFYYFRFSDGVE